MKNYDETVSSVFERIGQYEAAQKRKKSFVIHTVLPMSCVCFFVLLSIGVWKMNDAKTPPPKTEGSSQTGGGDIYYDGALQSGAQPHDGASGSWWVSGGQESPPSGETESTSSEADASSRESMGTELIFALNRARGITGAAKLNFSEDKYYSEIKSLSDVKEYFGEDFSQLFGTLAENFEYIGRQEFKFYYEYGGSTAYDKCNFAYKSGKNSIRVGVSKMGVPYDCQYAFEDPQTTDVNGISVLFGAWFENETDDEFKLIFADFECNGLSYRIEVENETDQNIAADVIYKLVTMITY